VNPLSSLKYFPKDSSFTGSIEMLGIIIPTMNRSEFVIRQLKYYASVNCPFTIYIGDSSNETHVKKVLFGIEKLKKSIKVVYKQFPELNGPNTLKELIRITKEKYVAFVGDDDFLVPNSLKKCATFLDANPEYSSAQGKAIIFSLSLSGAYGNTVSVGTYHLKINEYETPTERLLHFLSGYWVPLFSVHRTRDFFQDHINVELLNDIPFTEIMANCMTIIRGKSKQLDCLYLVRQGHDARLKVPNSINWVTGPNWQPSYQVFHDTLRDALMEKEEIDQDTASKIVRATFEKYLSNAFIGKQPKREHSLLVSSKELIKQSPGLKQAYHQARSAIPIFRNEMSLQRLLKPKSPYHEDFVPVYNSITMPHLSG
jgi:glycosyltransferase domain-containing protein